MWVFINMIIKQQFLKNKFFCQLAISNCKPGWTLAVDFPNENASSRSLLSEFDRKITEVGGRVYLAKDSGLEPELVTEMYPRFAEWKQIRKKYSQENFWQSDFSRRLKLD